LKSTKAKLSRDLGIVSGTTLMSRLLGFVRDWVIARVFGADAATDAFFIAFKLPNLFRRLFVEGAFASALVPLLVEYQQGPDQSRAEAFANKAFGAILVVALSVSLLGIVLAPMLMGFLAPGWLDDDKSHYELAVYLIRLTLPYIFFITLTAFAGGLLHSQGRFGATAFTPVLLNLTLIAAALWWADDFDVSIHALVAGLAVGFIEETFFRGGLYGGMRRTTGLWAAALLSASYYAALHFIDPVAPRSDQPLDWSTGFEILGSSLANFADPSIADSLIALISAGVLLALMREYRGHIALAMGIHAGWVLVIKISKKLTRFNNEAEFSWLAGGYDQIIGWLATGWLWLLILAYIGWHRLKIRSAEN
jgi:peptidoglycan biosynthesis protein MviN/MurJ (putative lipid II flippase)